MRTLRPFLLLIALLNFFVGSELIADDSPQTSRADQWKEKREQKAKHLSPFQPSKMERRLVNFEKKGFKESLGIRFWDVYANIGQITTGAGLATTFRYFRANLFDSPLDVSASVGYSIKGYRLYSFQFGNILRKSPELFLRYSGAGGFSLFEKTKEKEGKFYLYGEIQNRYFPEEDFFGLGNDSREEDKSDYLIEGNSYDAVAAVRFSPFLGAFVKAGLLQPDVERGKDSASSDTQDSFDDTTAPGLNEQPDYYRLSTSLFFDYRDVPGNPNHGGMYTFTYARFMDRGQNEFDFHRLALDLRQYLPLWSDQRILAVRFYTSSDDPEGANARVPFYLMQTLGGSDSIRGYSEFRFRDRNLFFLSTEYRWLPHPIWELVLFYDTGKVFPQFSDFDLNDLKRGYGFGVRIKSAKSTVLRFDIGHSEEGTHLYFKFNTSF